MVELITTREEANHPLSRLAGRWRQGGTVIAVAALVAALTTTLFVSPRPRLVWNVTPSMPLGLYVVSPPRDIRKNEVVIARVPGRWRALANERGYIPSGVPLVKRVVAVSGDVLCAWGPFILLNGRMVAKRLVVDRHGRWLPWWSGCQILRPGTVFLLTNSPASFDGRYLGPTASSDLIGRANRLWAR